MNIKQKAIFYSALSTAVLVGLGLGLSSIFDERSFNMFALDKTLLIVGLFVGLSKTIFDWEVNKVKRKEREKRIEHSIRDKQEYLLNNTVGEADISSLILVVPANPGNLTAEYLINYFRPRQVSLIWSTSKKSYDFAKDIHRICCERNIKSVRDPNESAGIKAVNFFVIDNIVTCIKESIKLLNCNPSSIGIDLTSGTALCSIGSSIAAMETGINPIYVVVDKSHADEEFIVREDIDKLEDVSLRSNAIEAGGIFVFKAPWSQEKGLLLDLLVKA